jgi:hypothetical protein
MSDQHDKKSGDAVPIEPELPNPPLDAGHATPALARLITRGFRARTVDPGTDFTSDLDKEIRFTDVALGWQFDFAAISGSIGPFTERFPESARSYPTRVLGDERSAIVFFVDTADMFGSEFRIAAAINFRGKKIVREVDYSDGRHFGIDAISKLSLTNPEQFRTPPGSFPADLGENAVAEDASPMMGEICAALSDALSGADIASATAMFAPDAVFEDLTLHARFVGSRAIGAYLQSSLSLLPYGPATKLRHVLGSERGGGYEWLADTGEVRQGLVALEVGEDRFITRLTTIWDGSLISDDSMTTLLKHTIER